MFKLLEHVVCTLNYVPFPELVSLSIKLKESSSDISRLALRTMIKFINFDAKYAGWPLGSAPAFCPPPSLITHPPLLSPDVCREVGILDVLNTKLLHFASELKEGNAKIDEVCLWVCRDPPPPPF